MTTEMTIAIVGVASAILGSVAGGLATSLTERWKYKVDTRTDAYKAFIDAMSRLLIFNGAIGNDGTRPITPAQQAKVLELIMDLRAAKTKIALYGSPEVMAKLGTFSSAHAQLADDDDADAYIAFVQAMRKDSFADDYGGFGADLDRLLLRDEQVTGPGGTMTTMRDAHKAAKQAAADGEGASVAAAPTSTPASNFHTSFSYSNKPAS